MFESTVAAEPLREELARLRVDGSTRSIAELVALVEQCQSVVNQATALQFLAMAHLAAIEDVQLEDGTVVEQHRGLGHQRLDAPALVSDQLGLSDAAASSRMTTAVEVVTRVPAVLEAMASGRLDGYRAGVVAEELRDAPRQVSREVVARIDGSLGAEPPATLRRRVRRALGAVDAELLRARAARARAARSLRRWPGDEPGVDTWLGSFPVEQARSGWAVIDGLARQYVREGRASGVDEARADALMDLIHSRATGTFTVQLAVPADRLAPDGLDAVRGDAEDGTLVAVTGLGMPGETHVRRTWLRSLTEHRSSPSGTGTGAGSDSAVGVGTTVVACAAGTGALLDSTGRTDARRGRATASQAYRPPPALVELVKARDGRCRFPGCTVSAVFCDLDHVRPWPTGPTEAGNLMCLCRRHHRVKQSLRWRVRIAPDATVTWTDPTGRPRTTLPLDLLQLEHRGRGDDDNQRDDRPRRGALDGRSTPADEVGVLWSAWEEELTHQLATAERHPPPGGRPIFLVSRPLLHRLTRGPPEPALSPASVAGMTSLRSRLTQLWRRATTVDAPPTAPAPPPTAPAPPRQHPYPGDFTGTPDLAYVPEPDGQPDPGEIVWTWVPYEEDHRQGKDRPVLLVGRDGPWLLGLMLTSKDHDRDHVQEARHGRHWQDIGSGAWDGKGRPSEVRVDRILRIDPGAVRREGAVLDRDRFDEVAAAVRAAT